MASLGVRAPRRAVVAVAAAEERAERFGRELGVALREVGIEVIYLGSENSAARIAAVAADRQADAVELCLTGGPGVLLLRQLLRELIAIGRRDVSIVVHRARQ